MMTLAVMRAMGWSLDDALETIAERRDVVDFADVYVRSVEDFIRSYQASGEVAESIFLHYRGSSLYPHCALRG